MMRKGTLTLLMTLVLTVLLVVSIGIVPAVASECCIPCHGNLEAVHGNYDHTAILGSGEVLVFNNANIDHGAGHSIEQNCTLCHYESLTTQHRGNCALCHSGANLAGALNGNWNKSCSQGSCHPSIHAEMGADHNGMYWNSSASCSLCHDGVGDFPGSGDNCSSCHNPDFTVASVGDHRPPMTTSDAQSAYVGSSSIHLNALDVGTSGVSLTWYSLDYREWKLGNDIYFSAPTSGSISHNLRFYSTDHAMNVEAVKSVTFTVQTAVVDTTSPTTSSSFNPTAGAVFKASQAVTLTATDSSSGVKATYYKVDAGAFSQGTSFTVTDDGQHSFSYYSVDNANNTESTHASNIFRIDTVTPTTTCNAVSDSNYTGAQSFTLSATDAGSGVAGTWYQLDAGAWVAGTSVPVPAPSSGTTSHTISWYSRDVATNVEATKSVTFTVETIVADTTPPTTSSSFNPAAGAVFKTSQGVTLTATDNGSGVEATYYKIDSGPFTQGSSFSVTGDGEHSFSYYSVDNANNTESTHVANTFRIDTIAPTTTSSAMNGGSYIGAQTFSFSATDTGSGVAGTWYRLDNGAWTAGTSLPVPAPGAGTASHSIDWYSRDVAGNQEATHSVAISVSAGVTGTTRISFRTDCSGISGWVWVYWQVMDAGGNPIPGLDFSNDDCGHPPSMETDFDVPSGSGYVLYGEFSEGDSGEIIDSATRAVGPSETAPGATVEWWFH